MGRLHHEFLRTRSVVEVAAQNLATNTIRISKSQSAGYSSLYDNLFQFTRFVMHCFFKKGDIVCLNLDKKVIKDLSNVARKNQINFIFRRKVDMHMRLYRRTGSLAVRALTVARMDLWRKRAANFFF